MDEVRRFNEFVSNAEKMDHLRQMSKSALLRRENDLTEQAEEMMGWSDSDSAIHACVAIAAWWGGRSCADFGEHDVIRFGAWCSALYPAVGKFAGVDYRYMYDYASSLLGVVGAKKPIDPDLGAENYEWSAKVVVGLSLYGGNPWRDDLWDAMVTRLREVGQDAD